MEGNNITHNCLTCMKNFSFNIIFNNYQNCYDNISYYNYMKNQRYNDFTSYLSNISEYSILITDQKENIEYNIQYIINNILKNESKEMGKEEEIKYYNEIIKTIETFFTSGYYDTSNLDKGEDEIIKTEKITIILTTAQNQKNNSNTNLTIIDLGECENLLRRYYNISDNETLYMKKIDVKQEKIKIPKIVYDVYYKFSGINLTKLNLSICENTKISLSIPIIITENIDKLNSSSGYFNDKCYSSTSDTGTDISLNDRKKEFIEGNKTVCQEYCYFSEYNSSTQKVNCSCQVKEFPDSYENMNINKEKLYENFKDIKNDATNLGITSCNVLGSTENIESNTGFFLLLIIIVLFIIVFIIFCTKGYNLLEDKIDEVIYKKFPKESKTKKDKIINSLVGERKKAKRKKKSKKLNTKSTAIKINNYDEEFVDKNSKKEIKLNNNLSKNQSKNYLKNKIKEKIIKPDTDYELNWLLYEEALKFDKREKCDYYCSLIKSKQLFLFTFCSFDDYNSGIVKKFMLFLSFALHYTTNTLFFTESTIHQIYIDEGKFNFSYQISYILYSSIISIFVLRLILQFLVLTDKDILEVKQQQSKSLAINMKKKKLKYMKIKFGIFFILNFILLVLFWYYLTCFNAIYKNTQIYLIENTFISFGFSLFYPFIINILPTIIRMYSLHSSKKNQNYLYKVSQILQLL